MIVWSLSVNLYWISHLNILFIHKRLKKHLQFNAKLFPVYVAALSRSSLTMWFYLYCLLFIIVSIRVLTRVSSLNLSTHRQMWLFIFILSLKDYSTHLFMIVTIINQFSDVVELCFWTWWFLCCPPIIWLRMSRGTGNMTVELFSTDILFRVWRYLSWNEII